MQSRTRDICVVALLVSLALVISVAEGWLPQSFIPLPGVKLGLANIVTLFALTTLGFYRTGTVLLLRCLLAALFGGGVTAFVFSISGGILALAIMQLLLRTKKFSLIGVSIAGAAMHGVGQIIAAMLLLSTFSVVFYLPFLLFSAIFTGALIGFLSDFLLRRLRRIPQVSDFLSLDV